MERIPRAVDSSGVDNSNLAVFGWYNILNSVTGGDITKEKEVVSLPILAILNNFVYNSTISYNLEMSRRLKMKKK